MRQELVDRIMMCLTGKGITDTDILNELVIITNDYEITNRVTTLSIRHEDKNNYFLQKFMVAKTVKGCTDRTLSLYRTELVKILQKIGKPADEIEADDIRLYLALRQKRDKVSKTTANNELRYMRSFFGYLAVEELIPKNPIAKIERIKCDKQKKNAFTELEVEKLRDACANTWETAVVETLLSTGCRVTELVNIHISDLWRC